jgi:hypothetical protein
LYEDGVQIEEISFTDISFSPDLPIDVTFVTQGDPRRQNAVTYVFRAWASYRIGTIDIVDTTPVNIRFTVVPDADIQEFLRNVQSDDQQPIKEFDRP